PADPRGTEGPDSAENAGLRLLLAIVTFLGCASGPRPPPRDAQTARANWYDATVGNLKGQPKEAAAAFDALIDSPGYEAMTPDERHDALLGGALAAFRAGHTERGRALARRARELPQAGFADWNASLIGAVRAKDYDDAAAHALVIARRWPDQLPLVDAWRLLRIVEKTQG